MAKDLDSFFKAVLDLKSVNRTGWASKAEISSPESVADHVFSMCASGMLISDILGLDTEKAMRMILLHDLAESIVGDYMPGQVSEVQKKKEEDAAMKKILASLPAKIKRQYAEIWREYLQNKTELSRFVHRIDKLEMALQADRYKSQGHSDKLDQFFESAHKTVDSQDDILKDILKALNRSASKRN